jgi:electron transfer flavoprotein alpha/beta subunit
MIMRIVICLKPVPDPRFWNRLRIDPETKTLVREGIPSIMNPLDKKALEAGLQLREKRGGEVVTISMAPRYTIPAVREALAMGADLSILLSDPVFAGSDALGTSYILASAIRGLGGHDIILCGDQTLDGSTSVVGTQIAEFLNIPSLIHITNIEPRDNGEFLVHSQIEHGYMRVRVNSPLVLSVAKEINEPRYITLMNILEGEKKEIRLWSSQDLSLPEPWVGLKGSQSQMADFLIPEAKRKGEMLREAPAEMAQILADRLHRLGFC